MSASLYGFLGFVFFALVHWLCDFFWGLAVSLTVFKSKKFLSQRFHEAISGGCGLLLIAFGAWFVAAFV
jgi:threonine/homoserine/homoserine lactone efflux protein